MSLSGELKGSFVTGILLIAPLVVTVFVVKTLVGWSLQFINPVVASTRLTNYTGNVEFVAQGLAAVLIVTGIVVIGYLAQHALFSRLFGNFGRVMNFVPLVNTVYGSVRQVANSLVERDTRYDRVVLVEYPRNGLYSIGLVTGEGSGPVSDVAGDSYTVFLPNSPNPTAGRLVVVPADDVHEIDMNARSAIRFVVTTGMVERRDEPPVVDGGSRTDGKS